VSALDARVSEALRQARSVSANAKTVAWLRGQADVVTPHETGAAVLGLPLRTSAFLPDRVVSFEGPEAIALWNLETGKVTVMDLRPRRDPRPWTFNAELWQRFAKYSLPRYRFPTDVV
jgi:hypothetical protein